MKIVLQWLKYQLEIEKWQTQKPSMLKWKIQTYEGRGVKEWEIMRTMAAGDCKPG